MTEESEERMTEGEEEAYRKGMAIGMFEATRDVSDELIHLGINYRYTSPPIAEILCENLQSVLKKMPFREEYRRKIWEAISNPESLSREKVQELLGKAWG
jgi:hypothetical protein